MLVTAERIASLVEVSHHFHPFIKVGFCNFRVVAKKLYFGVVQSIIVKERDAILEILRLDSSCTTVH